MTPSGEAAPASTNASSSSLTSSSSASSGLSIALDASAPRTGRLLWLLQLGAAVVFGWLMAQLRLGSWLLEVAPSPWALLQWFGLASSVPAANSFVSAVPGSVVLCLVLLGAAFVLGLVVPLWRLARREAAQHANAPPH
eukprot:gnl/Hemi2/18884_TR6255_c0_g11_i1.p2 gnl/Hemi2/18884_TR6255_c0_g11~~gnl/Hemi2/18884_TR6255_c0_g11_i1.p2  ORF type:complete len:139 (-),score=46.27 gnl/Hemi2/18884_TR6255_c0_g11_i1:265-681(-)